MNYTIYWGDNLNETLTTANSQNNGTYYHPFNNASDNSTTYYWSVNLTDTNGQWVNETYYFKTRYELGYIQQPTSNSLWIIGIFGIIAFILLFIGIKTHKKKNNYRR